MNASRLITYGIWAAAAFAVFYVAKTALGNSSSGANFGVNGAFSQDTWTQDFGVNQSDW